MLTWKNRIFGLYIPVFFMTACGQSALVQPDLIRAKFQTSDKKNIDDFDIIDFSSQDASALPSDTSSLKVLQTSGSIILGFSEFLDGDSVEKVVYSNEKTKTISDFIPVSGVVEIACCDSLGKNCKVCDNIASFGISYRPDGGYVAPPDTPVSNFPPPSIKVTIDSISPLPVDSVIVVSILSGPLKNTNQTPMAQVSSKAGPVSSVLGNLPVAAAAWFRTKHFGIVGTTYDADNYKARIQFNAAISDADFAKAQFLSALTLSTTLPPMRDPKSNNTAVILTFNKPPDSPTDTSFDITVTGLGIGSTQFTVPGKN
ncbi:MAG: hypothetical protein WCK49_00865 [Myxococcaceae bacterium]